MPAEEAAAGQQATVEERLARLEAGEALGRQQQAALQQRLQAHWQRCDHAEAEGRLMHQLHEQRTTSERLERWLRETVGGFQTRLLALERRQAGMDAESQRLLVLMTDVELTLAVFKEMVASQQVGLVRQACDDAAAIM
eukprot:SAG22_NODE_2847_length_2161_cov_1.636760_2_plen_138_part_01